MQFVGNVAGLRSWIALHNLPSVPDNQAAIFRGGVGLGQVFGASTASGKHVLVSYDNGSCQVIALSADPIAVRQMLLANFGREGIAVVLVQEKAMPNGESAQQLYRASAGSKRWLLSITSKPYTDAPNLAPELHLVATIDPS